MAVEQSELEQEYGPHFDETVEEEVQPVEEAEVEEEVEEPEESGEYVEFEGKKLSAGQLRKVTAFMDWTDKHPDQWAQVLEWEQRGYVQEPTYQPEPVVEPETEYEDPAILEMRQQLQATQQFLQQKEWIEAKSAVDDGIASFQAAHEDLGPEEFESVLQHVRSRKLLETIPGDQSVSQRASEVKARFEEAYRVRFFEKAQELGRQQVQKDMRAKRRAASAGTSAASAPRVEPAPQTEQEVFAALTEGLRQAMES